MQSASQAQDRATQVVALAAGHDPTRLRLSAAEGYLLSRIDGRTPWRLLREIGGIPSQAVDACLERWLAEGLIEIVGGTAKPAPGRTDPPRVAMDAASAPKPAPVAIAIDTKLLDPTLDLACDVQRRILEFEQSLSRPYHELLGVPVGADPKVVKRAYFKLSKEFHPDRYFRKPDRALQPAPRADLQEGPRGARNPLRPRALPGREPARRRRWPEAVDPVVTATATTHGGQPAARAGRRRARVSVQEANAPESEPLPRRTRSPLSKLDRLAPAHALQDRPRGHGRPPGTCARDLPRRAESSLEAGRLNEAEAGIRIAITFDPARAEFKEALGALRIRAAGDRATKLLATPSDQA
jgi:hypothetical protein